MQTSPRVGLWRPAWVCRHPLPFALRWGNTTQSHTTTSRRIHSNLICYRWSFTWSVMICLLPSQRAYWFSILAKRWLSMCIPLHSSSIFQTSLLIYLVDCVTSSRLCSTLKSAASWWVVKMRIQCTCFRDWGATQVFLFSSFLFFSSFSLLFLFFFWFILLPIPILVLINFVTNIADNFGFKTSQTHKKFHFAGLRVTAPSNRVFTSGSFSPLLVVIFAALNVSMSYIFFFFTSISISLNDEDCEERAHRSSQQRHRCNGTFLGQLVVKMSRQANSLWCCSQPSCQTFYFNNQQSPISPTSRPWVHHLSHQRVGEMQLPSMYVLVSHFLLPFFFFSPLLLSC